MTGSPSQIPCSFHQHTLSLRKPPLLVSAQIFHYLRIFVAYSHRLFSEIRIGSCRETQSDQWRKKVNFLGFCYLWPQRDAIVAMASLDEKGNDGNIGLPASSSRDQLSTVPIPPLLRDSRGRDMRREKTRTWWHVGGRRRRHATRERERDTRVNVKEPVRKRR